MSTYVLIHGAFHGGWCWDKVVPLLEAAGHKVVAPDLPSHGRDDTPIAEVTLDTYARRACEVAAAQSEPVIIVGHSMGGRESKRVRQALDKVYSKEQSGIDEAISRMQFISLQKIVSY